MPTVSSQFVQTLTDSFLDKKRMIADPPADLVIKQIVDEQGAAAAKELFDILIGNIALPMVQLPLTAQQFIRQERKLPSWANLSQIANAQALFVDHGPKFLLFLYFKSLPTLYACAHGAEVLAQTGRLSTSDDEQFKRRIAETGQFLMDVMSPGSFSGIGKATEVSLKIRLIHASIRSFIPSAHWDEEVLGKPINQEDLAITLMTFSISLIDALEATGIAESKERTEAFFHCWRIIGHLLGIQEELLPSNVHDGRIMLEKILDRQAASSEAGILLSQALIDFVDGAIPAELLKNAPEVLVRFLAGDRIADHLKIHAASGCLSRLLPGMMKTAFKLEEKMEDRSEKVKARMDKFALALTRFMVDYFNKEKKRYFHIPTELQSQWLVDTEKMEIPQSD